MSRATLEERVTFLEQQLAAIQVSLKSLFQKVVAARFQRAEVALGRAFRHVGNVPPHGFGTDSKNGTRPKDWRSTIGIFTGDEVMKRIDEAALQYREADRRKARRRQEKGRKRQS